MAKKLKVYNGSSWEDVTFAITPPTTNVTNSFTTNQVIEASTSAAALRITQTGSGEALRVEDSSNPDSTPFVVDASGQLGVGIASPVAPVQIHRDGANSFLHLTTGTSGSTSSDGFSLVSETGSGNAYVIQRENADLIIRTNNTERMRINSVGNVGIGTSSITDRLDILVPAGVDSGIRFTLTSGGSPLGQLTVNSSSGEVKVGGADAAAGNYYLGLYTLGTQRVRIDANGQVNVNNSNVIINSSSSVTGANWDQAMLHLTGINAANSHPGLTWHAPGASAVALFHTRGTQCIEIRGNSNVVDTTSGRMTIRNIAISTSTPSGGLDGDMWATYV
jgi:hypothetical protein